MIDAGNSAVPKTTVPSLLDGLGLIGRGRIAALVGHLRDGVGVVDIDVPGEFGNFLAAEVADWLRRRDCWVLERPSGGAKGRWHVFFAHRDFHYSSAAHRTGLAAAVSEFLIALADSVKVPRGELDLRDAVRPLSSPHRHGVVTTPKGDLRQALRGLKRVLPDRPAASPLRPRSKIQAPKAAPESTGASGLGLVVPLGLQRWKRQVRPQWHHYLLNGEVPPGAWAAGSTKTRSATEVDRSLVEAACTREMVWAIGEPELAWRLIRESHPRAMTKAKHQGYSWWITYVWNQLVRSASEFNTTTTTDPRQVETPPAEIVDAVAAARAELARLIWTVPARKRAALQLVGHHLLDRALREHNLRIPCPERDLVLDTGLGDRKTIRRALAYLNGRLGTLHTECLSRTERESTSYEFEINSTLEGQGREIPPPALDPPPAPRGLWATLPRSSHGLWRTLLTSATPLDLDELAVMSGMVESVDDLPSKSQRSTAKASLVALSRAGMVRVDENGCWQAATQPRSVQVEEAAGAAYARQVEIVEAERATYRAGLTSSWTAGRARAIKAQKAREKAWWDNLSPAVRAERSAVKRYEFDQMSITQQEVLKSQLAERRIHLGAGELEQYQTWLRRLPADEYVGRSLERKQRFGALSPAERGASVAAWDRHRLRYGLTAQRLTTALIEERSPSPDIERAALLPDDAARRDAAFLERQGNLLYHLEGKPSAAG